MRILVLSFYYEPDLSAGSFRTTAFISALKVIISDDDHIDVLTTMPNRYKSFSNEAKDIECSGSVCVHRFDVGRHKSGFVDQAKLFVRYALAVNGFTGKNEKYDVVYATSSRLMTAFLGSVTARRQKSRLFLDIRDIFTDTMNSVFAGRKLRYVVSFFRKVEKYTVMSADCINLVSEGFRDYFAGFGAKAEYSYITNGIDDVFLNYDFSGKSASGIKIITYAGNIGEGQGLDKIIPDMARKLGLMYQINVVGDGGLKGRLADAVKDIENVKLMDPVNRSSLLKLYKNSDYLFLHLNDYDAFKKVLPSKVFEYAATGKFIIAGVGGYAGRFISENIAGSVVFEPCDADDFISKFREHENIGSIDRKKFIEEFSRSNLMKILAARVYEL